MKTDTINKYATHPLQSYEWGEFRKKTGIEVIRRNGYQMTIHKIPHTPWNIGYVPKSNIPTPEIISDLKEIGKQKKCIFIQLEPNASINSHPEFVSGSQMLKQVQHDNLRPSVHPLFTKYTFVLDLTKSEEELLKNCYPKTRYNIKVAQKHNVTVTEDNSDNAFETYLKLTKKTTSRQQFFAHSQQYHRFMWEALKVKSSKLKVQNSYDELSAHLLTAKYKKEFLVAWILFVFKDTLYYPYGASSNNHREVMASNLMMWETIKLGKKLGLKKFDMWGALGPNANIKDPWYGFHRFKQGYGPKLVEFVGSYDLVINPLLYELYKIADKLRWFILKFKR